MLAARATDTCSESADRRQLLNGHPIGEHQAFWRPIKRARYGYVVVLSIGIEAGNRNNCVERSYPGGAARRVALAPGSRDAGKLRPVLCGVRQRWQMIATYSLQPPPGQAFVSVFGTEPVTSSGSTRR